MLTSSVVITMFMCLNGLLLPGVTPMVARGNALVPGASDFLLLLHNGFRSSVARGRYGFTVSNMNKLTWDVELAAEARLYARYCGRLDLAPHLPQLDHLGVPLRGLNHVMGPRNASLHRMFRTWGLQRPFYDSQANGCHWGTKCHEYMQLVSAGTERVGCAINPSCGSYQYLVCLYSPGLNDARPVYTEGSMCTGCVHPQPFCQEGTCVACNPDVQQCECRKTCARSGVLMGDLDTESCSCDCWQGSGPNCDDSCRNPEQYLDYDICSTVTQAECRDPSQSSMLAEFCPEQCVCGPDAILS